MTGPRPVPVASLVVGLVPRLLLAVAVAVPLLWWRHLPDRLAAHWGFSGTANGSLGKVTAYVVVIVVALLGELMFEVALWEWRRGGAQRRAWTTWSAPALAGTGTLLLAVAASLAGTLVVVNRGVANWHRASLGWAGWLLLAAPLLVTAALTAAARRAYGRTWAAAAPVGASPHMALGATGRAVWVGHARAPWAAAASGVVTIGAAAMVLLSRWQLSVALLVLALVMLSFSSLQVSISQRGVRIGYGPCGAVLTRVALSRVERAGATDIAPMAFGYRGSLTLMGTAVLVIRKGPALVLALRGGKQFTVTVDDAGVGADLLNALLAQQGLPEPGGGAEGPAPAAV